MSSMIHKVKDALKPSHEGDAYDTTHTGSSSMPGTFDSTRTDTTGASKYANEPTQSSYQQDQPYGSSGISGQSTRDAHRVPDEHLMDPADREHGSNIMERDRKDYGGIGTATSGSQKLHKSHDPRSNYDNSARAARSDQEAVLRQQENERAGGVAGYGTTSITSASDQAGREPHNSRLANKLDPRVDSTQVDSRTTGYGSKHSDNASYGATSAAAAAAGSQYHSGTDHSALPMRPRDEHSGIQRKDVPDQQAHSGAPLSHTVTNPQALADERHRHKETKHHGSVEPVPYSMTGMHTSGRDSISAPSSWRKHFFCHDCGHRNETAGLKDPSGNHVTGKSHLFCMHCGHKNHIAGQA
jgi:hypothetical protein